MSAGSSEEGLAFSEKVDSAVDADVAAEQARVQGGGAADDTICLRNLRKVYGAQGKAHSKVRGQIKILHVAVLLRWGLPPCAGCMARKTGHTLRRVLGMPCLARHTPCAASA